LLEIINKSKRAGAAIVYLESYLVLNPISPHTGEVGRAIDLRLTEGIKKVLDKIKESNKFNMRIVDETNVNKSPHYHITIYNSNY
jgi:hypothetical protein